MNVAQAKTVFIWGTAVASVLFAALTYDTHLQFSKKTHEDKLTAQVASGKWVWQKYNCNDCHTILGIGGYYAPDLTKVTTYRDTDWLKKFINDPEKVWPQERKMPNLHLSDQEISDVIAFLSWVSEIDTNGWPPKPLMGAVAVGTPGKAVFMNNGCSACHKIGEIGGMVGPDLTKVGSRRDKVWIIDQLRNPKLHNPQSIMPSFAKLPDKDIEELADYLSGLR
ncbi:MAG TPA: c-type cytochrome [Nitrospirota bacterium]